MQGGGYKKYMKQGAQRKDYSLINLFIISFFVMLFVFTFLIKYFSPSVDVSIGDYKQETDIEEKTVNIDDRLNAIQDEDQGRTFEDLMKRAEDIQQEDTVKKPIQNTDNTYTKKQELVENTKTNTETVYKVFIGTYTSAEQAKVAKDIIQESNSNLSPIVKCIGSNNYTLQVGIFKNKNGAEALLADIKRNHMPGRIVQED